MIVMLYATDQRAKKLLRDLKVVDCAPPNRPMHLSIIRFSAQQFQRGRAHRQNFATVFMNRQNRRFVQNDPLSRRVNNRVNGTKIYGQVISEKATENIHACLPQLNKLPIKLRVQALACIRPFDSLRAEL